MDYLYTVLQVDRTTVKTSIGFTPYKLEYLDRPVLLIELEILIQYILPQEQVYKTAKLVTIRARAVERRKEDLEEAKAYLRRMRERGKEYFDRRHNIRDEPLKPSILVLVYNTIGAINISNSRKLLFR